MSRLCLSAVDENTTKAVEKKISDEYPANILESVEAVFRFCFFEEYTDKLQMKIQLSNFLIENPCFVGSPGYVLYSVGPISGIEKDIANLEIGHRAVLVDGEVAIYTRETSDEDWEIHGSVPKEIAMQIGEFHFRYLYEERFGGSLEAAVEEEEEDCRKRVSGAGAKSLESLPAGFEYGP